MSYKHIIVSLNSFESDNPQEIITSNANYITKLYQKNIHDNEIYEEALQSYYLDYYLSNIQHLGFQRFMENIQRNKKIVSYISEALQSIKLLNHFSLFTHAFPKEKVCMSSYTALDTLFKEIQIEENLQKSHSKWLKHHPQLKTLHTDEKDAIFQEQLEATNKKEPHIEIIKELCRIVNEEFIRITAGDRNNPYHQAWHFKTDKNYYYMIKKKNLVSMYNSFTKEIVIQGKLINNKTDKSIFANILKQMWA